MTKLAGISLRKNTEGHITHITIEVDKHKELMQPLLKQLGIDEETETEQKYSNALSLKESLQSTIELVDKLFDEDAKSKN